MKPVKFKSNGLVLSGNLYYPENFQPGNEPTSAIVVGHPTSGVKEQTAGLYAKRLAANGFITLAFDAAYQGESEGMPRGFEDPTQRTEDFKSAVAFLTTLKEVDPKRIGVLGICGSGGYSLVATATDHTIKALATVSGVDIGDWYRKGSEDDQDPQVIQSMLDAAAADRLATLNGEAPGTYSLRITEEQANALGGINFEAWEYYCTDIGKHPNQTNFPPLSSLDRIAGFYSPSVAHLIAPRPVLLIAGAESQTLWLTKDAYEKSNEPKELYEINGATHFSLYYKEEHVNPAVVKLTEFFRSNL
ncbi:alpha/beta hydrolase [Spirosoma utsteinense]|uniref:Xaa-Pro dipeptidyl-peptidase-like domain-containing protein n=1 Tax=Spirosoma utsteinense TaxID=2585773 RepID=A0ABR6WG15_9BACT|nr:alpha/beta hydrolase [Spirosoma utsteinense]MBC3794996.1 hypothetical protein [Spirosoma utsteinense]